VPICCSWIDADLNRPDAKPSEADWSRHWEICCREAAAADIVLFVAFEGEIQKGALLEVGAALGAGKRIFAVTSHDW